MERAKHGGVTDTAKDLDITQTMLYSRQTNFVVNSMAYCPTDNKSTLSLIKLNLLQSA